MKRKYQFQQSLNNSLAVKYFNNCLYVLHVFFKTILLKRYNKSQFGEKTQNYGSKKTR